MHGKQSEVELAGETERESKDRTGSSRLMTAKLSRHALICVTVLL
jgi:hypothetical protein